MLDMQLVLLMHGVCSKETGAVWGKEYGMWLTFPSR